MTKEERTYITLDEFQELEFACGYDGCGCRYSCPINKWAELPDRCPKCNKEWFRAPDYRHDPLKQSLVLFLNNLEECAKARPNFALRFRLVNHNESVSEK